MKIIPARECPVCIAEMDFLVNDTPLPHGDAVAAEILSKGCCAGHEHLLGDLRWKLQRTAKDGTPNYA